MVCLVHREEEDEDGEVLLRALCHQSGLILQAEGLTTGFCKDVHGQVRADSIIHPVHDGAGGG